MFPVIPYHVVALKCLHRRIIETKATFWKGRGYHLRTFGTPLLLFLPRNGFSAFELYHYIWNFIQHRYLNQHSTYFTSSSTPPNGTQSIEYDAFNAIANAWIHIFGGNVMSDTNTSNDDGDKLKVMAPPFVLRRVDKFGTKCSRSSWDQYSIGTVIELEEEKDKMVELDDEEYVAIDWNEDFFQTVFSGSATNCEETKSTEKVVKAQSAENEEEKGADSTQNDATKDGKSAGSAVRKVDENKTTSYLNNMGLVFEQLLDDPSVIRHYAQTTKMEKISIGGLYGVITVISLKLIAMFKK